LRAALSDAVRKRHVVERLQFGSAGARLETQRRSGTLGTVVDWMAIYRGCCAFERGSARSRAVLDLRRTLSLDVTQLAYD
jgi:hypothetical protein